MTTQNRRVKTFVSGATTFTAASANGVYVEDGDASGPGVVNRIIVTGAGAMHDMDGTDDAALIPQKLWNVFVFVGAHPNAHSEYANLCNLVGKSGTLTLTVPTATTESTATVTARLLPLEASWGGHQYRTNTTNQLTVKATWQLKALL